MKFWILLCNTNGKLSHLAFMGSLNKTSYIYNMKESWNFAEKSRQIICLSKCVETTVKRQTQYLPSFKLYIKFTSSVLFFPPTLISVPLNFKTQSKNPALLAYSINSPVKRHLRISLKKFHNDLREYHVICMFIFKSEHIS